LHSKGRYVSQYFCATPKPYRPRLGEQAVVRFAVCQKERVERKGPTRDDFRTTRVGPDQTAWIRTRGKVESNVRMIRGKSSWERPHAKRDFVAIPAQTFKQPLSEFELSAALLPASQFPDRAKDGIFWAG